MQKSLYSENFPVKTEGTRRPEVLDHKKHTVGTPSEFSTPLDRSELILRMSGGIESGEFAQSLRPVIDHRWEKCSVGILLVREYEELGVIDRRRLHSAARGRVTSGHAFGLRSFQRWWVWVCLGCANATVLEPRRNGYWGA